MKCDPLFVGVDCTRGGRRFYCDFSVAHSLSMGQMLLIHQNLFIDLAPAQLFAAQQYNNR